MSDRSRLRLFVLRVIVLSLLATLLGRLWYLQMASGSNYRQAAAANQIRDVVTPATRGEIVDDAGNPLVRNQTALVVTVDRPTIEHQADGGAAVLTRLAKLLGTTYADLYSQLQLCGTKDAHTGKIYGPPLCWNGSPYQPVPVKVGVSPQLALAVEENQRDYPGVATDFRAVRQYPQRTGLAGHLLGYLSPITEAELKKSGRPDAGGLDLVGRSGLEATYDAVLRGTDGTQQLLVNAAGAVTGRRAPVPAHPGDNLVTSLDVHIQQVAEDALVHAVAHARSMVDTGNGKFKGRHYQANSAAAVVLQAKTGRIVAMASYPGYDPSLFVGGISTAAFKQLNSDAAGQPLVPRAYAGQYAPGSTFKAISASDALRAGVASTSGAYNCPSVLHYHNDPQTFQNFEGETFGGSVGISLQKAIEVSCDTVFYPFGFAEYDADQARITAHQQPQESLAHTARAFGVGTRTGVDLPGEAGGRIPDRAWKKKAWEQEKANWCQGAKTQKDPYLRALDAYDCASFYIYQPGDAALFEIGQGDVLVTPLQLATAYAAIANGGTLYSPRVGKALIDANGKVVQTITPPVRGKLPISPATLSYLQSALRSVVDGPNGTASNAFAGFPIPVAGKTGTADVANGQPTAWFASYAPADNPEYVVLVMVTQAGQGGLIAAPAVREIYQGIYGVGAKAAPCAGHAYQQLPTLRPDGTVAAAPPCGGALAAVSPPGSAPPGSARPAPSPSGSSSALAAPAVTPHAAGLPAGLPPDTGPPGRPS